MLRNLLLIGLLLHTVPAAFGAEQLIPAEVRQRLAALSPEQRETLMRNKDRFDRLPADERRRMQTLHDALSADPRESELRQVMQSYTSWLKTLPSGQRMELLSLPAETRIAEIKRLLTEQDRKRFSELASRALRPSDREAIVAWLGDWVLQNQFELLRSLPGDMRRRAVRGDEAERRRILLYALRKRSGQARLPFASLEFSADEVAPLLSQLSPTAKASLEAAKTDQQRNQLLRRWIAASLFSRMLPRASLEDLGQFFERLDPSTKEHLENLPRDRMRAELQRLYLRNRLQSGRGKGNMDGQE